MPFIKTNVSDRIESKRETDPEFRKAWDDFREEKISPRGSSWDELEKQLFTPQEIAESKARVAVISKMINAKGSE